MSVTCEFSWWGTTMYKACAALSAVMILASSQASGQPEAAPGRSVAPKHSHFHPSGSPRHHIGRHSGPFFPATGGVFLGDSNGPSNVEITQPIGPISGDFSYTYKYDVPWDWAHRYPPSFFAGPPEASAPIVNYRPGCATQTVTVPGADGKDQTINMIRC